MTKRAFLVEWLKLAGTQLYFRSETVRPVECVTLQTGGSWGSAPGYYIGGEHTKPEPFYGWEGVQS